MSRQSGSPNIKRKHYYVDEVGDPTLFGVRGKVLIGSEGCSPYFAPEMTDVDDRPKRAADLAALRARISRRSAGSACAAALFPVAFRTLLDAMRPLGPASASPLCAPCRSRRPMS